mmetsp:Transcript_11880/g.43458  ORF Transcript_11880/g.43458 Transcript_11880/m.43458 type:complete len:334 (-) Transcript_11880:4065-5066(-)
MGLKAVIIVLCWYIANIGTLVLNKFLLPTFRFPIFLTMLHMASCFMFSLVLVPGCGLVPFRKLPVKLVAFKISGLALTFTSSVVLGNASLQFLALSYNQMIGATTPVFTAFFALLIQQKIESLFTYLTLIPIVCGIMLSTRGELEFVFIGAVVCVLSTALRALKSVLQGVLLSSSEDKIDSMNLLLYMAPIACVALLPVSLVQEPTAWQSLMVRPSPCLGDLSYLGLSLALVDQEQCSASNPGHMQFRIFLGLNLVFAYCINLFNFLVTQTTSPLTLQVLGAGKGALATFVSWLVFNSKITYLGCIGYAITISGVFMYSESKRPKRVSPHKTD